MSLARGDVAARIRATTPEVPDIDTATIRLIFRIVCDTFNVRADDLAGNRRWRNLVAARQVAMTVARANTGLSLPRLGVVFNRDHATVVHSIQRVLERDDLRSYAAAVQAVIDAPGEDT